MERQSKKKTKKLLINYLPKAASPVTFRSPALSPMRRANSAAARFSRRGVSIIPADARRRPTKGSHEPTSPEVSCIGTVKLPKDRRKMKMKKKEKASERIIELMIEFSNFRLFGSKAGDHEGGNGKSEGGDGGKGGCSAPSLGQMRRFASGGRRPFADFDWAAQVAPVSDSDEKEEDEEVVELSAERKREIDLWRRRNLNLRLPLQTASQST